MSFDAVVFNQQELLRSVGRGAKHILLCDGKFLIPQIKGITYTVLGTPSVNTAFTADSAEGIAFVGFEPMFAPPAAFAENKTQGLSGSYADSFSGSFGSSYSGSLSGSFGGSYSASFSGSFGRSYSGSFGGSFSGSGSEYIFVGGYGIDLI